MSKGYSLDKVRAKQENRANDVQDRNFGENVLSNLTRLTNGKDVPYIAIDDLYEAPVSWNFYSRISENKIQEMIESLLTNGLLNPIIVWEKKKDTLLEFYKDDKINYEFNGDSYLILSGHTRSNCFKILYEHTKDEKYLKIPAIIYKEHEINIDSARNIIVDTNYVQRNLSIQEKVESIMWKYDKYDLDENVTNVADKIGEDLGITPRSIHNYRKIGLLNNRLKQKVYDGKLTFVNGVKLAKLSYDTQQWIVDNFIDKITDDIIKNIKPSHRRADIENLFNKEIQYETVVMTFDIPKGYEDKFKTNYNNWIKKVRNKMQSGVEN